MGIEFEAVQKVIWSMVKALPTTIALSLLVLFFSMIIAVIFALCEYLNIKKTLGFIRVYTSFFGERRWLPSCSFFTSVFRR